MQSASVIRRAFASALIAGVLAFPPLGTVHANPAIRRGAQSWEGFYAGLYAGAAWGKADASSSTDCGSFNPYYFRCGNQAVVESSGTGSSSDAGFNGGVKIGRDFQFGETVFGGVVDFGSLDLEASRTGSSAYVAAAAGVPFRTSTSLDTDWLLTMRGRIGWTAAPDLLVYATGGLALTNVHTTVAFSDDNSASFTGAGSGSGSKSETKAGWTVGGGAEWMLARNWALQAEYLYADFGSVSTSALVVSPGAPTAVSTLTSSTSLSVQTARIGLSYYFGN